MHAIPARRSAICCAVSAAVLLMSSPAHAQQAVTPAAPATPESAKPAQPKSAADEVAQVLVVGARASEQTSTIVLRTSANLNTINKKFFPDWNLIYTDKFLDGRLGVLANISGAKVSNEAHVARFTQDSNNDFNRAFTRRAAAWPGAKAS